MRLVGPERSHRTERWGREEIEALSSSTLAEVGVELPPEEHPAFDGALERARRSVEVVITDGSTVVDDVTRACGLLLRIDTLQRVRADARRPEIAEYDGFRSLSERLGQLSLEDLLDAGANEVCGAMGFSRALFSSVSASLWLPRTVHLDPASGQDTTEVRTFVTNAAWRLDCAPLESEVIRRKVATLVECAQESHRTFRPLMEVTRSRSYVVAPVRARRRVIGLLHGDNWGDGVGEDDLGRVEAYAQSFGAAVERAALRRRVQLLADQAAEALRAAAADMAEFDGDASLLTDLGAPRRSEASSSHPTTGDPAESARLAQLTPREFDVLAEISHGLSNAQIAGRLCLTEGTVKSHVKNVLRKLQVRSRVAATALLTRHEAGRPDQAAR